MNGTDNPNLVYSGMLSLKFLGGRTCFFFRPIVPSCGTARMAEPVRAGDTFKVSLKDLVRSLATMMHLWRSRALVMSFAA